jgi:hypothetical protein
VTVTYPFGKTASKPRMRRSLVLKRQQEIGLKQLEVTIVGQVREAVRQIDNSWQRVQAAQTAREATQQQLTAGGTPELGRALDDTRIAGAPARTGKRARQRTAGDDFDYNRALIQLERVQRIQ